MQKEQFFPYSWHVDEKEEEFTSIRIYGLNHDNENVCVQVDNFTPYIYLELPSNIGWSASKAQLLGDKIDKLLGRQKPMKKALTWKKKLYGAHINPDNGERILYPFLFCAFYSVKDIKTLSFKLKAPLHVVGLGSLRLKIHESDANPILQLVCCRKISTAGWIKFTGRRVPDSDMVTLCHKEYNVKSKNLSPVEEDTVPRPKIMGFDIEVNSSNPSAMPKAEKANDKIFQISCVFSREGGRSEDYDKYLLTLGDPDEKTVGYDVLVRAYDTEAELLMGFTNLVREENPNIIVGYNILGFDIPYMIARAKSPACCMREFSKQGFHKFAQANEKIIRWSSAAYKNQEFEYLDAEGRLFVDLLPLVRRDFKFNNYKLKTVSEYFLGQTKDPLSVKGIFKCYRIGTKKNTEGGYDAKARKAIGIVGKYCVQDSALVVRLMDKLKTWVGLTEMAKTCVVPIFTLYTQGQQIKVYSQLYRYCMYENIVVERDGYAVTEGERYVGAKVFLPVPGKYEMVVPFDFASLYPTTIIAYNIDYHTWVPDGSSIPDHRCHVMEWEDHYGCEHDPKVKRTLVLTKYIEDEKVKIKAMRTRRNKSVSKIYRKEMMVSITAAVDALKPYTTERSDVKKTISKNHMCAKRKYRFLKEPKGVMPTVIQNLLDARRHTRKVDMAACKKEIKRLETAGGNDMKELIADQVSLLDVLNKRQLSFKVSANSMYGAMGVRRGYLPFMPGAMCLDKDSQISLGNGFTRKIKNVVKSDSIWSYDNGQYISQGEGLKYNGKREVVRITLKDGRTLRCTPDHQIMTTDGWIEAGKLVAKHMWDGTNFNTDMNYSKVLVGMELPEDMVCKYEKDWTLLDYDMSTYDNREKALSFSRILGFILSDGSITRSVSKIGKTVIRGQVSLGTKHSANTFVNDIKMLTNKTPKITDSVNRKGCEKFGNSFTVIIPVDLVRKIVTLEGVMIGKRVNQPVTLPSFIIDPKCPLSIVREFVGGLFGGDGTGPSLSIGHPSFSPVQFGWTTTEKYKAEMNTTMQNIVEMLGRFDLKFWIVSPKLSRLQVDSKNPRWYYMINSNCSSTLLFAQKIGFRYCNNKMSRLSLASSYQRYSDNTRRQHINLVKTTSDMFTLRKGKSKLKCVLDDARKIIYKDEIPINKYASLGSCTHIYRHRTRPHNLENYKLKSKFFPTASEYTESVGCRHWFSEKKGETVYVNDRYDDRICCFPLDVIDVRYDGIDDVYDIVNMPSKSFIANGMVVHNCTCFMGRENITIVADTITTKHGGNLIYGDTDSNYIHFPHLKNATETWDYALKVAEEVTKLFPPPIQLEFEEEIYVFFLILSKKRYMYRKCLRDGVVDEKIGKKGVLLARRDNSKFVRDIYETVVTMIASHKPGKEILNLVTDEINKMCSKTKPYTDFVVTKAVGNHGGLVAKIERDEKGVKKALVGDYTVPILSNNKEEREEQMAKKGAENKEDFYLLCLPAQVQLAERIRRRGKRVDPGTRLEYVVANPENHTGKQYEKVESVEYFARHSDVINIDFMYYLKALVNPLDQVLDVALKNEEGFTKGFTERQYKYRWKIRSKLIKEINSFSTPILSFE